jgi:hypothetical protein
VSQWSQNRTTLAKESSNLYWLQFWLPRFHAAHGPDLLPCAPLSSQLRESTVFVLYGTFRCVRALSLFQGRVTFCADLPAYVSSTTYLPTFGPRTRPRVTRAFWVGAGIISIRSCRVPQSIYVAPSTKTVGSCSGLFMSLRAPPGGDHVAVPTFNNDNPVIMSCGKLLPAQRCWSICPTLQDECSLIFQGTSHPRTIPQHSRFNPLPGRLWEQHSWMMSSNKACA